jgi:hypothetical protein
MPFARLRASHSDFSVSSVVNPHFEIRNPKFSFCKTLMTGVDLEARRRVLSDWETVRCTNGRSNKSTLTLCGPTNRTRAAACFSIPACYRRRFLTGGEYEGIHEDAYVAAFCLKRNCRV